jgi:hypothetical protein
VSIWLNDCGSHLSGAEHRTPKSTDIDSTRGALLSSATAPSGAAQYRRTHTGTQTLKWTVVWSCTLQQYPKGSGNC